MDGPITMGLRLDDLPIETISDDGAQTLIDALLASDPKMSREEAEQTVRLLLAAVSTRPARGGTRIALAPSGPKERAKTKA